MSFGVGRRHGSDPVLLQLWSRPAAVALIQLLAWELPHTPTCRKCSPEKNKDVVIILKARTSQLQMLAVVFE